METSLTDPALWHRIQFAFTITYHYLFPQLTMGLAWFLVYWKWRALRTGEEKYNRAARFWARIFGLNFAVGVVTGIPMEFQFGTNWAGLLITILTWLVRPELLQGITVRPLAWLTLVVSGASAYAIFTGIRGQHEHLALLGSTFLLFGLLMTGAAALFPVMLFSTTDPARRLTAADCAAPETSLIIGAVWWFPALILALCYLSVIRRYYWGKVNVSKDNQGLY
jgi:Cytochrome bd terminal oxidase subunit I